MRAERRKDFPGEEMTGSEFERKVCQWFKDAGYWALNIPRSKSGQQPFDVLAIKGNVMVAADCKVISTCRNAFPIERVEVNQWLAFKALEDKSLQTVIGLIIWHERTKTTHFVSYKQLRNAAQKHIPSIELGSKTRMDSIEIMRGVRE